MSTTSRQDAEFTKIAEELISSSISDSILEYAVDYISRELSPDDVFSDKQLEDWAISNNWEPKER